MSRVNPYRALNSKAALRFDANARVATQTPVAKWLGATFRAAGQAPSLTRGNQVRIKKRGLRSPAKDAGCRRFAARQGGALGTCWDWC